MVGLCSDAAELVEPSRDRVDVFSLPLYENRNATEIIRIWNENYGSVFFGFPLEDAKNKKENHLEILQLSLTSSLTS